MELLVAMLLCTTLIPTTRVVGDIGVNNETAGQFFTHEIFEKYGNDKVITFEGFEHLLYSLGLGGRIFEDPHELSLHKFNGTFNQIHDSDHRHKRHTSTVKAVPISKIKQCLSPQDIIDIYGLENDDGAIRIDHKTFLALCPALVYQIDQKSCDQLLPDPKTNEEIYLTWVYAGVCVLIISATGLLGVAIVPVIQSVIFNQLMHFLVALAIGTLCGDAMLHLLPHALENHAESPNHHHNDQIWKCSMTLLTILIFYTMESVMRMIMGGKSHSHSHGENGPNEQEYELTLTSELPSIKPKKRMTPVALMVILGDGLHNLTDGLAIGAAFSSDTVTGFATALAVFCHELPHELGDFAVLIRSGMSIRKALYYNVLSSILSIIGVVGGLWLAEDHESTSQWIYAATAGTFLYIALADLVPEISNKEKQSFRDFIFSFLGTLVGFLIMLAIALYEDSLKSLF